MADITFSCWINAWSIDQGLRQLGGRKLKTTKTGGIVPEITSEPQNGDSLFFTDEASMSEHVGQQNYHYYPKELPEEVFDDKLAFAKLAETLEIPTIPSQPIPEEKDQLPFPKLVKARNSWKNGKHVHRGWVCESAGDFPDIYSKIMEKGFTPNDYFLQDWLENLDAEDNFSVCGFWDAKENDRNLLAVVQRTSSYNKGQSCSSAVAVIKDPGGLIGWTRRILNYLSYQGPFEIEYIRTSNGFKVLELNPRFWYQNGIFLKHDNGLIKRYVDEETKPPRGGIVIDRGTWVDGVWLIRSILKFQFRAIRESRRAAKLGRAKVELFPTLPVILKYFAGRVFRKKLTSGND